MREAHNDTVPSSSEDEESLGQGDSEEESGSYDEESESDQENVSVEETDSKTHKKLSELE